jgi:putative glutathione S-transferase
MSLVDSWRFYNGGDGAAGEDCVPDPLHPGVKRLKELYLKADPGYSGRFSVPVLWDKTNGTIVNNESSEIIRMLNSAFNHLLPPETHQIDIYPPRLQSQIDSANLQIYEDINNGV